VLSYAPVFVDGLLELMARLVAVGQAGGRADVARGQDLVIAGYDATGPPPVAGGPLGYGIADFHEILVPARASIRFVGHGALPHAYLTDDPSILAGRQDRSRRVPGALNTDVDPV